MVQDMIGQDKVKKTLILYEHQVFVFYHLMSILDQRYQQVLEIYFLQIHLLSKFQGKFNKTEKL